jgi:hypothetical protein
MLLTPCWTGLLPADYCQLERPFDLEGNWFGNPISRSAIKL